MLCPFSGILTVFKLSPYFGFQLGECGRLLGTFRFVVQHKRLEYRLRDRAFVFVLIQILHELFQFGKSGGSGFQFLLPGCDPAVIFLLLHPGDRLDERFCVILRILSLFPDVGKDKLVQYIFINSMYGAGFLAAAGVVSAHEGAVPPRCTVLVGEPFHLIPHLESAVRTVHKSCEDTAYTVSGGGFSDLLFVDLTDGVPYFP